MRAIPWSAALLAVMVHGTARGEEDHAKADRVFEAAQQAKREGRTADACKLYDEALEYNRNAVGTLLNVALCNEEAGRVATALAHYIQARDLALEHKLDEHRDAAAERIAKVEKLVPHLSIAFVEIAGRMKLVVDDKVYPIEAAGDLRLDPGPRHVVVTAPGRVPYETTIEIKPEERKLISIPALGHPVTVKSSRRIVGMIVAATGAGLAATGVGLGFYANRKYDEQLKNRNCTTESPPRCNPEGFSRTNSARTMGTVGTVVGFAGIAALGVGAYLWLLAPTETAERPIALVPTLAPGSAGVAAIGRF